MCINTFDASQIKAAASLNKSPMVAVSVQEFLVSFDTLHFVPSRRMQPRMQPREPRMTEEQPREPRMTEEATGAKKQRAAATSAKRLQGLMSEKGISHDHLRAIANRLLDGDSQISKNSLTTAARAAFQEVRREIALPLVEGGEHKWLVADPSLLVSATVRSSKRLEDIFVNAIRGRPSTPETPWNLLFTWDEFTPGNVLRPDNRRKTMVVNMSFEELGDALHNDAAWYTIAVARSCVIKNVVGGWSRMLRDLLKVVLAGPNGMMTVGVPMMLKGEFVTIYCKVGRMLSDGDGLRLALQWMGPASLHPCWRHWNVLKKDSGRAEHSGGKYVELDCHDCKKLKVWSNADLLDAVDVCVDVEHQRASGQATLRRLQETHTHLGYRATQHGLLADPFLRLHIDFMKVCRYDWAHTFLSDGVVTKDCWSLIKAAARESLFSQKDIEAFLLEEWSFPSTSRAKQKDLHRVFSESGRHTNDEHNTIKVGMSDLLHLYGLLRHFTEVRCPASQKVDAEMQVFQLSCKVVDLILAGKKGRFPLRQVGKLMLGILEQQMQLRVRTGGAASLKPKHHWAFDVAECLATDDSRYLLDTFCTERMHRRVKKIAGNCSRLEVFEPYVMSGLVNTHLNYSDDAWRAGVGLRGKTETLHDGLIVSSGINVKGEFMSCDEFCSRGWICWLRFGLAEMVGREQGLQRR